MIRLHFVLGAGISSRFIAWYGQGYGGFSHVDAILSDGTLAGARSDAIGGQPPGFQIRPPNYEKWARTATVELASSPEVAANWEAWQRAQVGSQYDKGAIIGFILGRRTGNRTGYWICSAAQRQGLEQYGFLHGSPIPDSEITPNTLYSLVTDGIGGTVIPPTGNP